MNEAKATTQMKQTPTRQHQVQVAPLVGQQPGWMKRMIWLRIKGMEEGGAADHGDLKLDHKVSVGLITCEGWVEGQSQLL